MKRSLTGWLLLLAGAVAAQEKSTSLFFISDTQQPMLVEKLWLKPNHNRLATATLLNNIETDRPRSVFMLGDVVGLGCSPRKWKKVDVFLKDCRAEGTDVFGLLGNHEVMMKPRKGERLFQQRFPANVRTGYYTITDSVAVVMLNSNFNALAVSDQNIQNEWYRRAMITLDQDDAVRAIIVCCHHAPFTNSTIVKCNPLVQENFVPAFLSSQKARLFITGHAHAFEHFRQQGKDFLVIGGGGGLHQPLHEGKNSLDDLALDYKPMFHYLSVQREGSELKVQSRFVKTDFSGLSQGLAFETKTQGEQLAARSAN